MQNCLETSKEFCEVLWAVEFPLILLDWQIDWHASPASILRYSYLTAPKLQWSQETTMSQVHGGGWQHHGPKEAAMEGTHGWHLRISVGWTIWGFTWLCTGKSSYSFQAHWKNNKVLDIRTTVFTGNMIPNYLLFSWGLKHWQALELHSCTPCFGIEI
jgi:hypothetical protein